MFIFINLKWFYFKYFFKMKWYYLIKKIKFIILLIKSMINLIN